MRISLVVVITALIILIVFPGYAQPPLAINPEIEDFLRKSIASLKIEIHSTNAISGTKYLYTDFTYRSVDSKWSYGNGIVVWKIGIRTPIWYHLHNGDFGPHSISWYDFNHDGQKDLFFFAGFEDVFETFLYLSDIHDENYNKNNFRLVYENHNDYSTVVDFDKDGQPEILDCGYPGNEHIEEYCDEFIQPTISDTNKADITAEYHRLAAKFDAFNFDYNMPDVYPLFNMHLFDPVKIYRIKGNKLQDTTHLWSKHLKWRIGLLKKIKAASDASCSLKLEETIKYLKGRIAGKNRPR